MIGIHNLNLDLGTNTIFNDANLVIYPNERIGLIGRNGAGKSTLLRLITGEHQAPTGQFSKPNQLKISFFNQDLLAYSTEEPLLQVVLQAFGSVLNAMNRLDKIHEQLATDYSDDVLTEMANLQDYVLLNDGYALEGKTMQVLAGLGFDERAATEPFSSFSGGWRMRALLAKCLLEKPDLLMLDEPTNHLDLPAIKWIEQYLIGFEGTLIVVSHDRYFLDKVCTRMVEVSNKKLFSYVGNYTTFEEQKALRMEMLQKTFDNQQDYKDQQQAFIDRFRYKASKAAAVQSRIKQLEKTDWVELPEPDPKVMQIKLKVQQKSGRDVVSFQKLDKAFEALTILKQAEGRIERGDKIALVGANGKGKSTLLKIIAGVMPYESGSLALGHNVNMGYFAQHQLEILSPQLTMLEELCQTPGTHTEQEVRNLLGSFLFSNDTVEKKIKVLSGGERMRVALAKMLLGNANFLLLDEPTNHLDLVSIDVLAQALEKYEGTCLVVSHDRSFLRRVATRVWSIEDGLVVDYPGNFEAFEAWQASRKPAINQVKNQEKDAKNTSAAAEQRIDLKEKQKEVNKLQKRMADNEAHSAKFQIQLADLQLAMVQPETAANPEQLLKIGAQIQEIEAKLNDFTNEWNDIFEQLAALES